MSTAKRVKRTIEEEEKPWHREEDEGNSDLVSVVALRNLIDYRPSAYDIGAQQDSWKF